jgi:pimeloyl-ACP methyl ester carboxylesterase
VAGLLAVAYQDENQVVVAVRGTDPSHYWQLGKNLLADASWAPGALGLTGTNPNAILASEVADAANFLYQVRQEFPNDVLTLEGHSLGGAIAQLLGKASGYTAIGFNAPGAAQFAGPLSSALAPAGASKVVGSQPGVDENIRMYGDQVSLAGTPIHASTGVSRRLVQRPQ